MTEPASGAWQEFWRNFETFRAALTRSKAINVNSVSLRNGASELVDSYFRTVRPELVRLGVDLPLIEGVDKPMQELLRLAQGRNAKRSYGATLKVLAGCRSGLAVSRDRRIGEMTFGSIGPEKNVTIQPVERRIIETLKAMLPSAAVSYEQAIRDLGASDRLSMRGTAVELREALREVLDHLAPDSEVMKEPGFALEADQKKPTMRQKARFVFRSRGYSKTAIKAPEDAASVVEDRASALVRSTYDLGSVSTHVTTARGQVQQLKMYVDTMLADLLAVHVVDAIGPGR